VSRRGRRKLPAVCVDEHLPPAVAKVFRPLFRTFEASRDTRFKGRDERAYIAELYRQNAIFVTSDSAYVEELAGARTRHAGLLYIPQRFLDEEKLLLASMAANFIAGACFQSPFAFRNHILYAAHDGMRSIAAGKDTLEFSWDYLEHLATARSPSIARRTRSHRGTRRLRK